jgi:GNAT superfamily N-acetyltransferase
MAGVVRVGTLADVDAIIAIDPVAAVDPARIDFIRRSVADDAGYVYEIDGRIAGYAVLEYTFFDNGWIGMLMVASSHRRQRIGTMLVRYLESICRTPKLFTSTNESNKPMQALMVRLGYAYSGRVENLDESDPELFYFKKLR